MIYYVIPARKGSKGFPGKNRKLFDFTYGIIPKECRDRTIITSDDDYILDMVKDCRKIKRDKFLSSDIANIKLVMCDVVNQFDLRDDDIIIMLYLTYPQRTWDDVNKAFDRFLYSYADSLLCKKDVKTHPYLCIDKNGSQIVSHDLYRRQDYPKCYEISHFISIFRVGELQNLNNNLYNDNTYFHYIEDVIDVDYENDMEAIECC